LIVPGKMSGWLLAWTTCKLVLLFTIGSKLPTP